MWVLQSYRQARQPAGCYLSRDLATMKLAQPQCSVCKVGMVMSTLDDTASHEVGIQCMHSAAQGLAHSRHSRNGSSHLSCNCYKNKCVGIMCIFIAIEIYVQTSCRHVTPGCLFGSEGCIVTWPSCFPDNPVSTVGTASWLEHQHAPRKPTEWVETDALDPCQGKASAVDGNASFWIPTAKMCTDLPAVFWIISFKELIFLIA